MRKFTLLLLLLPALAHAGAFVGVSPMGDAPFVRMHHTGSQSIPDATETTLQLNDYTIARGFVLDTTTNYSATVQESGLYIVHGGWGSSTALAAGKRMFIRLRINGSTLLVAGPSMMASASLAWLRTDANDMRYLSAGDVLTMTIEHNNGSAMTTWGGSSSAFLYAIKVAE